MKKLFIFVLSFSCLLFAGCEAKENQAQPLNFGFTYEEFKNQFNEKMEYEFFRMGPYTYAYDSGIPVYTASLIEGTSVGVTCVDEDIDLVTTVNIMVDMGSLKDDMSRISVFSHARELVYEICEPNHTDEEKQAFMDTFFTDGEIVFGKSIVFEQNGHEYICTIGTDYSLFNVGFVD